VLLPIGSDLGHGTKTKVPGTGAVVLYQARNQESYLQGWLKFLEISGQEPSFTLPNYRLYDIDYMTMTFYFPEFLL